MAGTATKQGVCMSQQSCDDGDFIFLNERECFCSLCLFVAGLAGVETSGCTDVDTVCCAQIACVAPTDASLGGPSRCADTDFCASKNGRANPSTQFYKYVLPMNVMIIINCYFIGMHARAFHRQAFNAVRSRRTFNW